MSSELSPSEHVLWSGSPVRYPVFDTKDRYIVPFGIAWLAVLGVIEYRAQSGGLSIFAIVVAIPFLGLGLYALAGRLIIRQVMMRNVVYTVTDKRIIMRWRSFGRTRERRRDLLNLEPAVLGECHDGVGTIRFGYANSYDDPRPGQRRWTGVNPRTGQDPWLVLRVVQNASTVRNIIERARRAADGHRD